MIRMVQSISAAHAKDYFSESLSRSDYYMEDQELNGKIQGKLADRLGITGPSTKEAFFNLCENVNPANGEQLTVRNRTERTVGYDINFHCPKSVSILHALSKDDHLMDAFTQSVQETMREIEADSKTRVRKDQTYDDRQTGELLWADFVHQTARPVDGSAPDPHLHAHCFVFNATWDDQEQKVKACQFRDIKRDMPYYQARFHKNLSDRLIGLGYGIKRTNKSFEIEGVPKRVIDLFSKRTDEIGRIAKEKGITDADELGALGARTRSKKQKGLSMVDLKKEWKRQIIELPSQENGEGEAAVRYAPEKEKLELTVDQCVDHAINHGFERASVLQDRRLLANAYRHSIGQQSITLDAVTECFERDDRIIHVQEHSQTLCTTKEVLSEEKYMVRLAREGQGKLRPLYLTSPKLTLDGQQAEAVSHVLTTPHLVSIIRGAAGTGKTTLMKEAIRHMEIAGKKVTVVAPTSQASRGVLKIEGFDDAETVAKLLIDKNMQKKLENQVLWVDEAGLLGTKDMTALLALATKHNARIILGGDTRQHSSVIRGDALRILNTVGDIKSAEVSKIYRQRNTFYKAAVEDLSRGDVKGAFEKLDTLGAIKEIDPLKPNKALVDDYVEAVKAGKSTLVVSPTHQQADDVTDAIRKQLKASNIIGKKEILVTRLMNLNLTEAEKTDWRNIQNGQYIQFNQNCPKIARGSLWHVEESSEKQIMIKDDQGKVIALPTESSKRYDVFAKTEIGISKGDSLRITRNGFDNDRKRLDNGDLLEVLSVKTKGDILLRNRLSKEKYKINSYFGHLSHAHCITSHASQGKTVDEVFISQPASTFPASDSKQFYVSVSRARDKATVYTDHKDELLAHAARSGDRQSAMELVRNKDKTEEMVQHNIRNSVNFIPLEKSTQIKKERPSPFKEPDYEPGI